MRFPVAPNGPHDTDVIDRFVSKVAMTDDDDSCWLWTAGCTNRGYGQFAIKPRGVRLRDRAHRVALEIATGALVPEGMDVAHSCDSPRCVRPSHLRVATHAENMNDAAERERMRRKLSRDDVRTIVERLADNERVASIAADFGVSDSAIQSIRAGATHRTVRRIPPRPRPPIVVADGPGRFDAMRSARSAGHTLRAIGEAYGVSKQRVEQLLRKAA